MADQPPLADGLKATPAWGPSVLRVICVAIALSYNRGCTIAQWLRRSLFPAVSGPCLSSAGPGPWCQQDLSERRRGQHALLQHAAAARQRASAPAAATNPAMRATRRPIPCAETAPQARRRISTRIVCVRFPFSCAPSCLKITTFGRQLRLQLRLLIWPCLYSIGPPAINPPTKTI